MAFEQQNNQVTGNEDFEQYLRNIVQTEIKNGNAPKDTNGQVIPQQPLELTINGQLYRFKDHEELQTALATTFQTVGSTVATLQEQLAAKSTPIQQVNEPQQPQFDKAKYASLFEDNPLEAQKYMNTFMGYPDPSAMKNTVEETQRLQSQIAAYQFQEAHPEFPGGNRQAANLLYGVVKELGLQPDAKGLELAYLAAREKGAFGQFQPPNNQQSANQGYGQQVQQGNQQWPGYSPAPPPVTQRNSGNMGSQPDWLKNAENMTPEQILNIFDQVGQGTPYR